MVTVRPWPDFSGDNNANGERAFMDERIKGWNNIVNEIESCLLNGTVEKTHYDSDMDFKYIINVIEASGIRGAVTAKEGKNFEISRRELDSKVKRFATTAYHSMAAARGHELRGHIGHANSVIMSTASDIISSVIECAQENYEFDPYSKKQAVLKVKVATALKEKFWEDNPGQYIQVGEVLPLPDAYIRDDLAQANLVLNNVEPSLVAPERFAKGKTVDKNDIEAAKKAFDQLPESSQKEIVEKDWAKAIKVNEAVDGAVAKIAAAKKAPPSRG